MVSAVPLGPGAWAFCTHRMAAYRHYWRRSLVSSVLEPVLFLAAMGLTLGVLVDRGPGLPGGISYLAFLAPGLLIAAAMQTAMFECSYPVKGALKWDRTYEAVLATPLGVRDLLGGHLLFVAFRIGTAAAAFLVVLVLFGAAHSPLVVLAWPATLLTGLAFAAPITALAAGVEADGTFAAVQRFVIIPMFLFSGTFFPVSQLPRVFEYVAWVTPLWHGVALSRGLALGTLDVAAGLGHAAYLVAWVAGGTLLAGRILRRKLVT